MARRSAGPPPFTPALTNVASLKRMAGAKAWRTSSGSCGGGLGGRQTRGRHAHERLDLRGGRGLQRYDSADGTLVECDFVPGATLGGWRIAQILGAAIRPDASSGCDGWRSAFKAFLFRVTTPRTSIRSSSRSCAGISLMSVRDTQDLRSCCRRRPPCAPPPPPACALQPRRPRRLGPRPHRSFTVSPAPGTGG